MGLKKHIPNFLTCCNLFCGILALVQAFEGNLTMSAVWVFIAVVFDFLDGFAARMLKVSSPIGKDLDSLADMVTFGVVPGVVMFKMIVMARVLNLAVSSELPGAERLALGEGIYYPMYLAFLIPLFSAVRLAKFNNDIRQSDSFIGLPTPANAIFCCSLPLIIDKTVKHNDFFVNVICNVPTLCIISCVFSLLLISEIPLFALKFKNFSWADNKLRFIFLAASVVLIIAFKFVGIPLAIVLYIVLSVINNFTSRSSAIEAPENMG